VNTTVATRICFIINVLIGILIAVKFVIIIIITIVLDRRHKNSKNVPGCPQTASNSRRPTRPKQWHKPVMMIIMKMAMMLMMLLIVTRAHTCRPQSTWATACR
jgi:hypothetical protein